MKTHYLKIAPAYFDAILDDEKTFEVIKDDRGFQKNDMLILCRYGQQEHGPSRHGFQNIHGDVVSSYPETEDVAKIERYISYILTGGQYGIEPGYIVVGLRRTKSS